MESPATLAVAPRMFAAICRWHGPITFARQPETGPCAGQLRGTTAAAGCAKKSLLDNPPAAALARRRLAGLAPGERAVDWTIRHNWPGTASWRWRHPQGELILRARCPVFRWRENGVENWRRCV